MSDLISVIVPVYNVEKYLPRCLDSLLAQTYGNLEIILINDGSSDGSLAVCNAYAAKDKRIKVIDFEKNRGVCTARNTALESAKGAYIGFVDADDYCTKDKYQHLYETLKKSGAQLAACGFYVDCDGNVAEAPKTAEGVFSAQQFLRQNFGRLYCWNKLFDANILKSVRFKEDIAVAEDVVFCVDALRGKSRAVVTNSPKCYYNKNSQSATRGGFKPARLTYFDASDYILSYARENNMPAFVREIRAERAYHATGFLRQIVSCGGADKEIISRLLKELRGNILLHLKSPHKFSNKIFALCCCVNFKLAENLYNFLEAKHG